MHRTTAFFVGVALLGAACLAAFTLYAPSDGAALRAEGRGPEAVLVEVERGGPDVAAPPTANGGGSTDVSADGAAPDAAAVLRAAIAADPGGDLSALDALFAAAAQADAKSAIAIYAELKRTRSAFELQWAARAILDAVSDDARLLETFLEVLLRPGAPSAAASVDPELARIVETRFVSVVIAALARVDPDGALEWWLRIGAGSFAAVPDETVRVWLTHDPNGVLSRAAAHGADERDRLIREWAKVDPVGAVAYAITLEDFRNPLNEAVLAQLAVVGLREGVATFDQALSAAALLPDDSADRVRGIAIAELAASDPDAAAARLAELGLVGRNIAVNAIARRYAAREPFSALAWARTQGFMSAELTVVGFVAETHPARALEIAMQTSEDTRDEALRTVIVESLRHDRAPAPDLASRLEMLGSRSKRYEDAITTLVMVWVRGEPDDALDWVVANATRLPDSAHAAAARGAPAAAVEGVVERLPPAARAVWLAQLR